MRNLIFGLLLVGLVGCDQNPLKDFDQGIREAEDPANKVLEPLEPVPREALFVEEATGSNRFNFVEGVEGKLDLKGRVAFIPKDKEGNPKLDASGKPVQIPFELRLDDILLNEDGSEATFERVEVGKSKEVRWRLTWTPPLKFVKGQFQNRKKQVKVLLVTKGQPAMRREFFFDLDVNRDIVRPKVISFKSLKAKVNEGERFNFQVIVYDDDSIRAVYNEKVEVRAPRLLFVPVTRGRRDLSSFLQSVKLEPKEHNKEQGLWTFDVALDIRDQEMVRGIDNFEFGIVAVSRFGVRSLLKKGSVQIVNRVSEPVITWDKSVQVNQDEHVLFNFDVFSPKSIVDPGGPNATLDEKVFVDELQCGKLQAFCKCETKSRGFRRIHCSINVKTTEDLVGTHNVVILARVDNPYNRNDQRKVRVTRKFIVKAVTPPTPPAPPVPTAKIDRD